MPWLAQRPMRSRSSHVDQDRRQGMEVCLWYAQEEAVTGQRDPRDRWWRPFSSVSFRRKKIAGPFLLAASLWPQYRGKSVHAFKSNLDLRVVNLDLRVVIECTKQYHLDDTHHLVTERWFPVLMIITIVQCTRLVANNCLSVSPTTISSHKSQLGWISYYFRCALHFFFTQVPNARCIFTVQMYLKQQRSCSPR